MPLVKSFLINRSMGDDSGFGQSPLIHLGETSPFAERPASDPLGEAAEAAEGIGKRGWRHDGR